MIILLPRCVSRFSSFSSAKYIGEFLERSCKRHKEWIVYLSEISDTACEKPERPFIGHRDPPNENNQRGATAVEVRVPLSPQRDWR